MAPSTGTELPLRGQARTFAASFGSNLKSQIRRYTLTGWTVSTILHPVFLIATAWVIARLVAAGGTPDRFVALSGYPHYLSFIVLGFAFQGLALAALDDGATAIYSEERWGTWELLALTPFHRFTWLFAKTLAGILASLVDLVAVLVIGSLLFQLQVTPATVGVAILGVLLTLVALVGVAFLMAALGVLWKEPRALVVILSPFVILFSGMMFPVEALPEVLQPIAYGFPLTHGIRIVRDALLLGKGLGALIVPILWLLATGLAFVLVGYGLFRWLERRARRKGLMGRY